MDTPIAIAAAAALSLIATAPAMAHAKLKSAQPAAGSTVAAPKAVTLDFSEGVVPKLCKVTISGADGKPVATGTATRGTGAAALVVPLTGALAAGTYTVDWHAVSVDSHRTQGRFSFTVEP